MEVLGLFELPIWGVFLLLFVGLIILYTVYMCWEYGIFKKLGVKGPKPTLICGTFGEILKLGVREAETKWYKDYNKIWGAYETCYPLLYIGKPELIRDIFIKEFNHFTNRRMFDVYEEPMDKMLSQLTDDHWRHVRNILTPTFSGKKLRHMTTLINQAADRLVENLSPKVDNDEDIDIKDTFGAYSMDVIASTAFGIQVDSQKNPDDPFVVQAKKFIEPNSFTIQYLMFVIFLCPFLIPVIKFLRLPRGFPKSMIKFFSDVVTEALADRRNNPSNHGDFLELMIQAEKEAEENKADTEEPSNRKGLTEPEILAQSIIFFLAGNDTTATTLAFVMYLLSVNPECLEKAVREVDDVLGDEVPDYESAKKLTYLEMCISEALRMYSVAPRLERVANDDTEVGGITIPKGMCVAIPISAIHMDPEYWPEPEKFDPERFTAEEKAKRDQFVYMPFGHGPRNCIAMRLALFKSKIAIARILQKFTVCKSNKTKEPIQLHKMGRLGVEGGLWIKMKHRNKD